MAKPEAACAVSVTANLLWALSILGVTYDSEARVFTATDGLTFTQDNVVEAATHQKELNRSTEVMAQHSLPELVRKMVADLRDMTSKVKASKLVQWLKDLDARLDEYLLVLNNITEKKL